MLVQVNVGREVRNLIRLKDLTKPFLTIWITCKLPRNESWIPAVFISSHLLHGNKGSIDCPMVLLDFDGSQWGMRGAHLLKL